MAKPELHFAHANGLPSAVYRVFLEALGERYDVRAVPAIGVDPRFPVGKGWSGAIEQVIDSVRTRCSGPTVAVGHSLGAVTTFLAAHRHPELFTKVVLLDPPILDGVAGAAFRLLDVFGKSDLITPAGRSAKRRDTWTSRDEARATLRPKGLFRSFDEACFEDYLREGLVDAGGGVTLAIPVATEVALFRNPIVSYAPYRGPLRVPAKVFEGAASELAARGRIARFARRFGMRHGVLPGGHMFPLERPRETAAAVLGALGEL